MRKPPVSTTHFQRSLLATAIALSIAAPLPLAAEVINVEGGCTLIKAIEEANKVSGFTGDGCSAGSATGVDTIVLKPNSDHFFSTIHNTYQGENSLPSITSKISIEGNGATIRRSGGGPPARLFHVKYSGSLSLESVTISGGLASSYNVTANNFKAFNGGAIFVSSSGTLNLSNSQLVSNGAVRKSYKPPCCPIFYFGGDGGAVYSNSGNIFISNTTISGNSAGGSGGGISTVGGTLDIHHSTLSGNLSTESDKTGSGGGGLAITNTTATLANSTVSGNTANAGGGILSYADSKTLTIINSTISNNTAVIVGAGGGIRNVLTGPSVVLKNTIIANNINADCHFVAGSINADNSNIIEFAPTCSGSTALNIDPSLGLLQDNGGATYTHALLSGSAAIDAPTANTTTCNSAPVSARAQNGIGRPVGTGCDIGAFEYAPAGVTLSVDATCSLENAIIAANSNVATAGCPAGGGHDTITLANSSTHTLYTPALVDAVDGSTGLPEITSQITISGNGSTITRDPLVGPFRILKVAKSGTLNLDDLTISNGSATKLGGGIMNTGYLSLTNSTLDGNRANNRGGGLASYGPTSLHNSTVSNNRASSVGGGLSAAYTEIKLSNSTVSGNSAQRGGGLGAYNLGTFTLLNSTVAGNTASLGAALSNYNSNSRFELRNTLIADNFGSACHNGGAEEVDHLHNWLETNSCSVNVDGDPALGPLADNGGPTLTHDPSPQSGAVGAGDNIWCATAPISNLDQRGELRPNFGTCDIGAVEHQLQPATITVNTAAATCNNLTDAILSANSNTSVGGCSAGGSHDTIVLQNSSVHDMSAGYNGGSTALPVINSQITIQGNGSILYGQRASRFFDVAYNGELHIHDTTISSGSALFGGAILAAGKVSLHNSTVSGNTAGNGGGAISCEGNYGELTLNNTTLVNNVAGTRGGGLSIGGQCVAIINGSSIKGNSASNGSGGGIYIAAGTEVTLNSSTLSGNTAASSGGAIESRGATVTANNSTFSGNVATTSAGGAIYASGAQLMLNINSSTIVNNTVPVNIGGAGIFRSGSGAVTINNTVIANPAGDDCSFSVSGATNWFGDATCGGVAQGDPNLGPLQNNGGPTETHKPNAGSGLFDAGDDSRCALVHTVNNLDQIGTVRPQNEHCDIGAVEFLLEPVVITVDPATACNNLVDAITAADTNTATGGCPAGGSHDTIVLQNSSVHSLSVQNNARYSFSGLPVIDSQITIQGNGATISRDNAVPVFRLFTVARKGELELHDVTLSNGSASIYGGAIFNHGKLSLHNSTISGNTSSARGGGIYCHSSDDSGQVTLNNTQIINNGAQKGAGIHVNNTCPVTLNNSSVTGNVATSAGGGFHTESDLTLNNSTVSGNTAVSGNGGGIYHEGGTVVANNSTLTANNSTLSGNSAGMDGGAIVSFSTNLAFNNSTLVNNMATNNGAALQASGSAISMNNTVISNSGNMSNDCGPSTTLPASSNWFEDASCSGVAQGDPKLGPLEDNGGSTQTHIPESTSPLIDAGDDALCAAAPINNLDQIGTARPIGRQCDIGSVEVPDDGSFFVIPIPGGKVVIFSL